MLVTTALKTASQLQQQAMKVADDLRGQFIVRENRSVEQLITDFGQDLIVVGKDKLQYYLKSNQPFFFHPNSASFRIKRVRRGEHDPFVVATGLSSGKTILDCTLGMGSDSIVASYVVGETGQVTAIEGNRVIAYLVKEGLLQWKSEDEDLYKAMHRIEVHHMNYIEKLAALPSSSFDIVYFDPMFETKIETSDGIRPLHDIAIQDKLTKETITEAIRVARDRVVVKTHWKSDWFEEFNFTVLKRPTSTFHFGYIQL
ncbi:class I SAM-dependent methyltransferase [Bacillus alkalicellulosilyticus]|uniref:class I SAM-dependent methyltransferase n=1 Tax=Alkalihalobacterium alkalicellulosilyticum TaxID=1912214 RepID=UPI0009988B6E|nr:class I SAM-dependent methyltransferase [Bacillus alkalicellulosilyticus]